MPDGYSRTKATDQALRFVNRLADYAETHQMLIALEPMGDLNTSWPRYLDGVAFAKELQRPQVRVMADLACVLKLNQPFKDMAKEPEYCVHYHIAGDGRQPGVGDRVTVHTRLFRILRDFGYERAGSVACTWVSTTGSELDFGLETAKALAYLQELRDRVYAE